MPTELTRKRAKLFKKMGIWPPFLGAGIRVVSANEDCNRIEVEMRLRWWNRNFVGTAYGGSLYSMCDPYFMLMLMANLGPDYIVWDKSATIRFKKPGRGRLRAVFEIPLEKIAELKAQADSQPKVEPTFQVAVKDEAGDVICEVDKLLYIRKKAPRGASP